MSSCAIHILIDFKYFLDFTGQNNLEGQEKIGKSFFLLKTKSIEKQR